MIDFLFGTIIGLLISILSAILTLRNRERIERLMEKTEKEGFFTKGDAEFFEPQTIEMEAMEELFEEDKAKGRDTNLDEIDEG